MYEENVRRLALTRKRVQELLARQQELVEEIEVEHPEMIQVREDLAKAKAEAEAQERQLRDTIENRFSVFGEDPDHPALGLRQYSNPNYRVEDAIAIAVDHRLYGLVKLDARAFEKVAPALWPHLCDWDRRVVRATIVRNLNEWAVEVEDDEEESA